MNHDQPEMRHVDASAIDFDPGRANEVLLIPGDFFWLHDVAGAVTDLVLFIPGDEGGSIAPIPVALGGQTENPTRWGWDGNEQRPTLTPSVWRNKDGGRNEWHGNVTAGRMTCK